MKATQRIARLPVIGSIARVAQRVRVALGYARHPARDFAVWLFTSRETTNFTYDLTELNTLYLASFIAQVTGAEHDKALECITELVSDSRFRTHVRQATLRSDDRSFADIEPKLGRRLGWYAIVRLTRPRIVVETGVDKGLGACVLTAALMRNSKEGHPGRYYGTDINPRAGYLLQEPYAAFGKILYGDSVESLQKLDGPIDLFINDSDHAANYEALEYAAIQNKLSQSAILLSDNAHVTVELLRFAQGTGRQFLFFKEQPHKHWYPGAGIGAAFVRPE